MEGFPANRLMNSWFFSHSLIGFYIYIPGGAGFLPSTVVRFQHLGKRKMHQVSQRRMTSTLSWAKIAVSAIVWGFVWTTSDCLSLLQTLWKVDNIITVVSAIIKCQYDSTNVSLTPTRKSNVFVLSSYITNITKKTPQIFELPLTFKKTHLPNPLIRNISGLVYPSFLPSFRSNPCALPISIPSRHPSIHPTGFTVVPFRKAQEARTLRQVSWSETLTFSKWPRSKL